MAGHSKWATTKHKKAALDAKRAKAFAQFIKKIEVAARAGGPDLEGNPALEVAVNKAKKNSVPNDNIDRAIKRGAGLTGEVVDYTEIMYEARGPQGSALLVHCLTDNRNRAASETRVAITRNGGTIADPGSVNYLFNRKGVVVVPEGDHTEDSLTEVVLMADVDAEEITKVGDSFTILSEPSELQSVAKALDEAGVEYSSDEVEYVPTMKVELDVDAARTFIKLEEALEELDDVQAVYSNVDMTPEVIEALGEE